MIIDTHCHYTTEPPALVAFRERQVARLADPTSPAPAPPDIPDDVIAASVQPQLQLQRDRGIDLTVFSPRASGMAHHIGPEATSREWAMISNNLIHKVCRAWPDRFVGVGQLPQSPGVPPANCLPELERIVNDLGFVGVNLNPDPSGGHWTGPPLTDRSWYPLYEKLCELDVPACIHVSSSCNRNFHHTGAHYINADTTAFMQLIQGDLFADFPTLRFIIPHGGGAVPYHWGRYRGLCLSIRKRPLVEHLMSNVFFDTCVYHLPGIELLAKVVPSANILFATEMLGAVPGIDPETGHHFDDTKRYIDQVSFLDDAARRAIFEANTRRVFPRLDAWLNSRQLPNGGAAPGTGATTVSASTSAVTVATLQQMKRDAVKIVAVVAWDAQIARIADRAGVDLVSAGDSVGVNLWGRDDPLAVTMDEMVVVCSAVRHGVSRALVSCDFPFGPLQAGADTAVRAAVRLVEAGADSVKLDAAAHHPDTVRAVAREGIGVFAQIGRTPQTAVLDGPAPAGVVPGGESGPETTTRFVDDARRVEDAGAVLIDFTQSGPVAGPAVAAAVSIPVLGGLGGGPWLDGRIRMAHAAIGYAASNLDEPTETYANVARVSYDAIRAYASDVRAGRQIRGAARR